MAFLTGQSRHVLKSWYTAGGSNKDFGAGLQMNLTRTTLQLATIFGAGDWICKKNTSLNQKSWLPNGDRTKTLTSRSVRGLVLSMAQVANFF